MRFDSSNVPQDAVDIINSNIMAIERWAMERTNVEHTKSNPAASNEEVYKRIKRARRSMNRAEVPKRKVVQPQQEVLHKAKGFIGLVPY